MENHSEGMSSVAQLRKERKAPPQQLVELKWETDDVTAGSLFQLQPPTCSPTQPQAAVAACLGRSVGQPQVTLHRTPSCPIILLHAINIHRLGASEPSLINSPTVSCIGTVRTPPIGFGRTDRRFHTSMFLLATFFTTAGNSSDAFFPLAIS